MVLYFELLYLLLYNGNVWNPVGASASNSDGNGVKTNTTSNTGGNETRGKNVGVIFCIKQ